MTTAHTLTELLPHRAPMLLLDTVWHIDEHTAQAGVTITPQSAFFDATIQGVGAWVGMEYMAQTIAAWIGQRQRDAGLAIKPGFLLGTRLFECEQAFFPAGLELVIDARNVYLDRDGIGSFDCSIRSGTVLAHAQIKAYLPDNPDDFIRQAS